MNTTPSSAPTSAPLRTNRIVGALVGVTDWLIDLCAAPLRSSVAALVSSASLM